MAPRARLLIVGPNWVGDMVMAEPAVAALSRARRDRAVDMLAPPHVLEIAARMPMIDTLLPLPFSPHEVRLGERLALGRSLRGRYDTAVILPNSFLSALVPWFAQIPERRGYRTEFRYLLVNRPVIETAPGGRRVPFHSYRHVAGVSDAGVPRLKVNAAQQAEVLQRFGLRHGGYISLFPGAEGGSAKRWPVGHFAALARRIMAQGQGVALLGGPRDSEITAAIHREVPGAVDLGGRTSLGMAVDIIAGSSGAIGNDTGLMHVAAATGVPVLGIYGPTATDETPPLSPQGATIALDLPCAPCRARTCPLQHHRCMTELLPDMVLSRFAKLTEGAAP